MSVLARRRIGAAPLLVLALLAPVGTLAAPLPIPPIPNARVQPFGVYDTSRPQVVAVTTPATFAVPVTIPPGGRLISAVAVPDRVWVADVTASAAPVRFRVVLEDGDVPVVLYDRTIDIAARPADRRWFDFGRDLGAFAGRQTTLRFETTVVGADAPGATPRPATLALWAPPEIAACDGDAPSLLLVTVDALRADHLGSAGYPRPTTPYLDRFAADGTRFAAAFSAGPKTIPSIPQILTGTYFFRHRPTPGLGTLLGSGTFGRSRAVVNNPFVSTWLSGEQPGFDTLVAGDLDARAITSSALRWLAAAGRCPTALYLHYLDTHTPYRPPPRYARRFIDPDAQTMLGLTFEDVTGAWQDRYTPADRQRIVDLYDGTIAWTDRQIGRLLRGLERRARADRTIVVVTADHGEEFWDHGQFFHGQSLFDELLHVPLLVRVPNAARRRVVEDIASTVDLVPTIADAAGFATKPSDGLDGVTLLPRLRDETAPPRRSVFATVSNAEKRSPPRQAVRSPTLKVIRNVADDRIEAYDLTQDPKEQHNLGRAAPGAAELLGTLDVIRHQLDGHGTQLRLRSVTDRPVRYLVQLEGEPHVPIVEPDRLTLEPDDRVGCGPQSSILAVGGTLEPGDEDQVRMDVLATSGTLHVTITLDGVRAPAGTLRLGAAAKPSDGAVDLADPALIGAPPDGGLAASPTAESSPGVTAPAIVSLWHAAKPADIAPPMDPLGLQRLRSLGYVE